MTNPYSAPAADLSRQRADDDDYQPRIFAVSGRIGRLRYIGYSFLLTLLVYATVAVVGIAFALGRSLSGIAMSMILRGVVSLLLFCLTLIPAKRRMNDLDHSGWMVLLMLIPAVNLFVWLYLVFARGTDGRNTYGPSPNKNPRGMIFVALIIPTLMVVGVIAAIAIPAYHDYTNRGLAARTQRMQQQLEAPAAADAGAGPAAAPGAGKP